MKLPIYQIDAFTKRAFGGNPAAVCPLDAWIPDATMQSIAAENNLAETAFIVRQARGAYHIRWFTPTVEVDLCGHATLASSYVVFTHLDPGIERIAFQSMSGPLYVRQADGRIELDFPSYPPAPRTAPAGLGEALGARPREVLEARALLAVFDDERQVRDLAPDMRRIGEMHAYAVLVTAPSTRADFVSRFFRPNAGIPEDPVTGGAHCTLVPFWSTRLGKNALHALQVSARGGELWCEMAGDRVRIAGFAAPYLSGFIEV